MKLCAGDIRNVYLETFTKEKAGLFAGPEFGSLAVILCLFPRACMD